MITIESFEKGFVTAIRKTLGRKLSDDVVVRSFISNAKQLIIVRGDRSDTKISCDNWVNKLSSLLVTSRYRVIMSGIELAGDSKVRLVNTMFISSTLTMSGQVTSCLENCVFRFGTFVTANRISMDNCMLDCRVETNKFLRVTRTLFGKHFIIPKPQPPDNDIEITLSYLYEPRIASWNISGDSVRSGNCTFNPSVVLKLLERDSDGGLFVYKQFGKYYEPPHYWKIEEGSFVCETPGPNPFKECSFGVNVATASFLKWSIFKDTWLCKIHLEDLCSVVIPHESITLATSMSTSIKLRCGRVQLIRKITYEEYHQRKEKENEIASNLTLKDMMYDDGREDYFWSRFFMPELRELYSIERKLVVDK